MSVLRLASRRSPRLQCERGVILVAQADECAPAVARSGVAASGAVLLVTPEYDKGIPGVFKNGIDWLLRPSRDIARTLSVRLDARIRHEICRHQ